MPYSVVLHTEPPSEALFSTDALRRAWQEVRRNGQAAGIDRMTMAQFGQHLDGELSKLRAEVLEGTYRPQKALRFYKVKPSGKKRPLVLWAVRDRVLQRTVHDFLTSVLEPLFLDCSFGFRPGRNVTDAVEVVRQSLTDKKQWIVDADIRDCFDSIPAPLMLAQVRGVIHSAIVIQLIDQWLHTPIVGDPRALTGVSQGNVLSPQLTNLYLHRFDEMVSAALPGTQLVRFADDFVILCSRKVEAQWALVAARHALATLRLQLNAEKTRVLHADEGFTFLGTAFRGTEICQSSTSKNKVQ
ncbi:MAG: reverse transcriptase domain-containing protein [Chloroflexota bacterium]